MARTPAVRDGRRRVRHQRMHGRSAQPVASWPTRVRVATPARPRPTAVAEMVAAITERVRLARSDGITLPSVVKRGVALTAAQLDPAGRA